MGNQKTLPTPEPKPEPVVTPSVKPAPEVEPVERAERSLLGFRPGDTLSGAGTPPSDGGALNGSGLIHPTGIRHRAALARSLQRRRGNAFVQRAVLQGKASENAAPRPGRISLARRPRILQHSAVSGVQSKLIVGASNDVYEQEADRVADVMMHEAGSAPLVGDASTANAQRRACGGIADLDDERATCGERRLEIQRTTNGRDGGRIAPANAVPGGGGQPLPSNIRGYFEPRFGHDFGDVRLHTDPAADGLAHALDASAFTVGSHIAFRGGQFLPESNAGRRLLAHELSHVVQQGCAPALPTAANPLPADQAPVSVQRDATDQSILPSYAQSLDDEALLGEIDLVEGILAAQLTSGEEYQVLSSNLHILRDELETRRLAFVPPATDAGQTSPAGVGAAPPVSRVIPEGGESVDRVGIINRDREPEVKLRSSPDTEADNIITTLPFNTHVQVIKRFPSGWLFVSTPTGDMGYVASVYVWMDLPEPNARLHRVESGVSGTAIAIAERYFGQYADDWGQDLRFYVNVLAWANNIGVPNTIGGWRHVHFRADNLIWIPSYAFARSLKSVVNSGSISYNIAESIGLASFIERVGELWNDFRRAISLSRQYIGEAIARHAEEALYNALYSLAIMLVAAIAILAISTAIGAAIGALAGGGVGAAPGAAAGFEVGMVILKWLGLAMLVVWIGQALWETAAAFGRFLSTVWKARGDERVLDRAAWEFAEAIGTLLGNLLEAIILFAAAKGLNKGFGLLRGSKLGKSMGESRAGEWLGERVRRVRAGETPIVGPRQALARFYRGVELVDANGRPIGEFDGVDLSLDRFVENKSASGLERINPRTGRPQQTPAQWAQKQIFQKTDTRIRNLSQAVNTRSTVGGSSTVPTLAEIQGIKHIHFVIDASTPALRAAVFAEIAKLRTANPGWTFTAEFGISVYIPPVPDQETEQGSEGE
jgi:hypothetical protein